MILNQPVAKSAKNAKKAIIVALYPFGCNGMDSWIDHGAAYTYGAVRQAGIDIDFLDMKNIYNMSELRSRISGYDIVGFGLKSSYYKLGMEIVDIAKDNGSKVIVGGYHATAAVDELLDNPDIDWILKGESEITFPKFLKDPGNYPRYFEGEKPQDLDALPFIDRSIYRSPIESCAGFWYERMVSVMTSRGCPYNCGFCQPLEKNHFGSKLRRRSVDSIIEEMKLLKDKYNPDCIFIHDDTFLLQPSWIEEFVEKYKQIGLPFWASGRADGICNNVGLVEKLIKVGWSLVSIGFESGSQRILDLLTKGTTVEQNYEAARIVKSFGAGIFANYMFGIPWETREDIDATFKMVEAIRANVTAWSFFSPYRGNALGEQCIKEGMSLLDRNSYNRNPTSVKCTNVDYQYIINKVSELKSKGVM